MRTVLMVAFGAGFSAAPSLWKNKGKITMINSNGMMKKSIVMLWLAMLYAAAAAHAAQGDAILGIWFNEEKDAKIEIFKCSEKFCGKIVWAKEPNYPAGSTEGTPGTPRLDHHNPDAAKRSRPILGLQIMNDFVFAGGDVWKGGTVYDPKSGNTYEGKMTLVSPDTLALRGFILIPLLGRSTTWTRETPTHNQ